MKSGLRYSREDHDRHLRVNVDASFAPPHEGFKSVHGVLICRGSHPLHWTSAKQPFITMSTDESELVGYGEGYQCAEKISELLKVINLKPRKILRGDSKAGITQLNTDAGAWRTRHLRLRAWKLREAIQEDGAEWVVEHCPGHSLSADGFTKALQTLAFRRFRALLSMNVVEENGTETLNNAQVKSLHHGRDLWQECGTGMIGAGLALVGLTDKKLLGTLLIAVGGLLRVKKRIQENERKDEDPEKRLEQEPQSQQKPWSQQNEKKNGTSRYQGQMKMYKHVMTKEDQDSCSVNAEQLVEGRMPGLRAFRMIGGSDSKSHGEPSNTGDTTTTGTSTARAARAATSTSYGGGQAEAKGQRADRKSVV